MLTTILTVNHWAEAFVRVLGAVLWQSTLLIAVAALLGWLLRRSSPVVRYWLWQIVAIKLLLMPFWTFAVPFPSWPESRPASLSTASQPAERVAEDSSHVVMGPPYTMWDAPDAKAAANAPSRWKPFAAMTWQAWLLLGWFAAVLWQIVRLVIQHVRLARLLRRAVPVEGELASLVAELTGQIGLRCVPTAASVAGDCPLFVCGLWRPLLVLPSRLLASLSLAERRQVILHELAHIRRWDLVWGWTVEIARIAYFFHPLVYWVAYQLRLERELACDQLAMARSGHPPADYAQTLVQVVSQASEPAALQAAALAAGLTGSENTK